VVLHFLLREKKNACKTELWITTGGAKKGLPWSQFHTCTRIYFYLRLTISISQLISSFCYARNVNYMQSCNNIVAAFDFRFPSPEFPFVWCGFVFFSFAHKTLAFFCCTFLLVLFFCLNPFQLLFARFNCFRMRLCLCRGLLFATLPALATSFCPLSPLTLFTFLGSSEKMAQYWLKMN